MKCAVAIVLALVGLSLANPTPLGLGLTTLAHAPGVHTSSVINHGYSLPRLLVAPVAPLIRTVYTVPLVTTVYAHSHGLGHGWHH